MTLRGLLACLLLVVVSGCKEEFEVRLALQAKTVATLAFTVASKASPEARPAYSVVRLIDAETKALIWHLRAAPFSTAASQASLGFPETPDGFEALVADPQLVDGHSYVLVVSGQAHGQVRFRVEEDGTIKTL